jgi:hypothetical protein
MPSPLLIKQIQGFFITLLFGFSSYKQRVSEQLSNLGNEYPLLRSAATFILYVFSALNATIKNRRIEPYHNNWILLTYQHCSKNENIYTILSDKDSYSVYMNQYTDFAYSKLLGDSDLHECLVGAKCGSRQFFRVCKREIPRIKSEIIKTEESRVRFLSLEVILPSRPGVSYEIVLNREIYLVDNEILSYGFIQWYFDHHFRMNLLEDDYALIIMDNTMEMSELKKNDYIQLERSSYKIVRVDRMMN